MDLQSIKNVEIQHTPKLPSALALELISLAVQERKRISARRIVETIIAFAKPFNLNPKRCQKVFEIVPSLRAGWTRRGSNVPKRKKESDDGSDRGWRSPDRAAGHTLQRYVQPCSAPFLSNLSRPHSKKKKDERLRAPRIESRLAVIRPADLSTSTTSFLRLVQGVIRTWQPVHVPLRTTQVANVGCHPKQASSLRSAMLAAFFEGSFSFSFRDRISTDNRGGRLGCRR